MTDAVTFRTRSTRSSKHGAQNALDIVALTKAAELDDFAIDVKWGSAPGFSRVFLTVENGAADAVRDAIVTLELDVSEFAAAEVQEEDEDDDAPHLTAVSDD